MFRVQTQVLDLHYHDEELAPAFQDRARRLYYSALVSEMEAVMEKHDLRESIFRIHKLELDLGEMDEENFDTEWVKRFRERFEEELEKRLRLIRSEKGTAEDSEIPLKKRQTEIFEHYLLHGSLPWSAGDEKRTPQSMAEALLNHQLPDLILILKKHGGNEKVVQRLVFQLSEKQIIQIIETVQPTEAKFIVETVEKVDHTRRKESFVKSDSVHFRSRLWELALRYVLEDRGSYFNTKEFVKAMLFGIADHFNVERTQLIVQFYKAILHLQKAISLSAPLWRILAEIYTETLEKQVTPFPFAPNPDETESTSTSWYEGVITPYTEDTSTYTAEPLPFVVPPDGFTKTGKPASETNAQHAAETANGFMPQSTNGKFSENAQADSMAASSVEYRANDTQSNGTSTHHTGSSSTTYTEENRTSNPATQHITENRTNDSLVQHTAENRTDNPSAQHTTENRTNDSSALHTTENRTDNPSAQHTTENRTNDSSTQYITENGTNGSSAEHTVENGTNAASAQYASESTNGVNGHTKPAAETDTHLLDFKVPAGGTSTFATPTSSAEKEAVSRAFTPKASAEPTEPEADITERMAQLNEADMGHVVERLIFDPMYADALQTWLWQKGADSSFRRRMGNAIRTVEQFEKIVHAIDAPHAPYVADFSKRLQADQEEHHLFPATTVQFRKDQYYVLLTVLLTRRGSYFNKKSFVKQVLRQLAELYGMEFRVLIETLVQAVPKHMRGLAQLPEILQLLNDLREDEIRVEQTQIHTTTTDISVLALECITQWIETGTAPAEQTRFAHLNALDFAQLWETLLALDEVDEKQLEHFFAEPKHLRHLAQTLTETTYQKTVQRFVPFHRRQTVNVFESVTEHVVKTGIAHSLSSSEFTRLRREWVLQKMAVSSTSSLTQETALEETFTFLVEKLGLAPEALLEKAIPILRKTFTDFSAVETFLRKWSRKYNHSFSPDLLPTNPDEQTPDELTQHFLKTWGNASQHSEAFQKEVLRLLALISKKGEAEVLKFLNHVFSTQTFPEFLNKQARPEFVTALARFPVQAYGYFLKAIVQDFRFLLRTASITLPQAEDELSKAAIQAWFLGERTEKAFVDRMLQRLAANKQAEYKTFKLTLRQQAIIQQPDLKSKLLLHLSTGETPIPASAMAQKKSPVPAKPAVRPPGIPYGSKSEDKILDNIGVSHAGIVLTWPFLTTYFKRLNLTENNEFVGETAQHRAVHLLQYLADPNPAPEPELVLAKLLCGLLPADPIPADFVPTDDEKNLAESLLKGIISQWKELSNTSVPTFRDTFLKRQGVLYQKSSGWELHPHSKTFDVLLDKLPWGVQIVKLPWMKTSLFCKWR